MNSTKESIYLKKNKMSTKSFHNAVKERLKDLNSSTWSNSIKQNFTNEFNLNLSKDKLSKTLFKLDGEKTREVSFKDYVRPKSKKFTRNAARIHLHFKTESDSDSEKMMNSSKFYQNDEEELIENNEIKEINTMFLDKNTKIEEIIEDDGIPVIDKLRMNIGQLTFDKAIKNFPVKLNMSNEDEYILAKDEFFQLNPQLTEFANLKLMKRK